MQRELEGVLRDWMRAAGHAPRHCFTRLRPGPDASYRLECSDPAVLGPALERLRAVAGPTAVTGVALPDPELGQQVAWVAASVAEVRREPSHVTEQVTQALQGEVLEPLLHEDGWVLARLPDGYIGWVRDWHLALVEPQSVRRFAAHTAARVGIPWGPVRSAPRDESEPAGETILGTRVAVLGSEHGWAEIELPGGRRGWLPEAQLHTSAAAWPPDIPSLLRTLQRFLGVPYLWGGKSPKGFDCSGLVQFAFGLHGIALPRDADEQARSGLAVQSPAAGDLLFFGKDSVTHVAVALGPDRFLHARGEVRINALAPGAPGHDADLCALWRGTRRVELPAV